MSNDILIKAEKVGKKFCRSLKKSLFYGVQDVGYDLLGMDRSDAPLRKQEFWANKNISFELKRGECLGLVGGNGAGKTTLLKMLNGLIKPDEGSIQIKGRVGALIALGAGFNPILTGRENVYIAASVYGLSKKEIDAKYEEIVEFAELKEFMNTPVQNYSSGMKVKLGFAVATAFKPDVLLIDEVLAVGDASFRFKCSKCIDDILGDTAIIFVSHNEALVKKICTHAVYLKNGKALNFGSPSFIYENYHCDTEDADTDSCGTLTSVDWIKGFNLNSLHELKLLSDFTITAEFTSDEKEEHDTYVRVVFEADSDGQAVCEYNSILYGSEFKIKYGYNEIKVNCGPIRLRPGMYKMSFFLHSSAGINLIVRYDSFGKLSVTGGVPCHSLTLY